MYRIPAIVVSARGCLKRLGDGAYWGCMRSYPVELRVAIVEALDGGLSTSEAAHRFGVSVSSVKRFRARYQQTGDLAPRPHPGRPARIRRDDARLLRQVGAHPDATLAEHCARWQRSRRATR